MDKINYSSNPGGKLLLDSWLDVRVPDAKFHVGNILEVLVNKDFAGYAKIVATNTFPYRNLTDNVAYVCCNNNFFALAKILRSCYGDNVVNGNVVAFTIQWTNRHLPTHQKLFNNYWEKAKDKHTIAYGDDWSNPENNPFTN